MNLTEKEFQNLEDIIMPCITAYREGRAAAEGTKTLQDCPYTALTQERKSWMRGYFDVREENKPN